jgi:glutaredoxin-like protein NrdH
VQEKLYSFFAPVWPVIVVRSALSVPGFRGISSRPAAAPVFHDPALRHSRSQSISLARQGKKIVGGEGKRTMNAKVTVYSKPNCQQCKMTYLALDRAGVEYSVVDITEKPEALRYITEDLGYSQAPVVVDEHTNENHWSGFRPDKITALTN